MDGGWTGIEVEHHRSGDDPAVSVVVATIPDRSHEVVTRHLREQRFAGDWELLVVDDPSLDRCEARNLGLERADAEIVAFTDDDTHPPDDWLSSIVEAFDADPSLVCVEGRVDGGLKYTGEGLYVGCNVAVRREAALAVGGWDSRFAGWREDTEFGWRMEADAAGDCAYRDDVRMVHPGVPRSNYRARQEALLRRLYPTRWENRLNDSVRKRLWRYGQASGMVSHLNYLRSVLLG